MRAFITTIAVLLALISGSGALALFYRAEVKAAAEEGREVPGLIAYVWQRLPLPASAPTTEPTSAPEAGSVPELIVEERVAAPVESAPPPVAVVKRGSGKTAPAPLSRDSGFDCKLEGGRKICSGRSTQ